MRYLHWSMSLFKYFHPKNHLWILILTQGWSLSSTQPDCLKCVECTGVQNWIHRTQRKHWNLLIMVQNVSIHFILQMLHSYCPCFIHKEIISIHLLQIPIKSWYVYNVLQMHKYMFHKGIWELPLCQWDWTSDIWVIFNIFFKVKLPIILVHL